MKFKSQVYTQTSGSVGGLTYSHNRGGMYTRARAIPVNTATSNQQGIRNSLANLVALWNSTLTAAQRDAWNVYGDNTPTTDSLGEPRQLSGINWYVACNVARLQCALTRVDAAPTTFGLATLTVPTALVLTASTDAVGFAFTNTDPWAGLGGALAVAVSPPQNPGISFYKSPFRFAGKVLGAASPPSSPGSVTSPFNFAVGNRVFVRFRAIGVDGRISSPLFLNGLGV